MDGRAWQLVLAQRFICCMCYVQFRDELEGLRITTETSVPSGNRDLGPTLQTKIYRSTARHKSVAVTRGDSGSSPVMCSLSSACVIYPQGRLIYIATAVRAPRRGNRTNCI
jgi:hypothetical protein